MTAALRRAGIDSFPALLAHEILPLGVVNAAGLRGDVHTILRPVLSHRAARAFFRGQHAELPLALKPPVAALAANRSLLVSFARRTDAPLPDAVHRQLTDEVCKTRPWVCATLLAQWLAEVPESPSRDETIRALLQQSPFRRHIGPLQLRTLAGFFDPDLATTDPLAPEQATRLSNLYIEYYFHGAPFSRDALTAIWQRCRDDSEQRCQPARARIERRIGPLSDARG